MNSNACWAGFNKLKSFFLFIYVFLLFPSLPDPFDRSLLKWCHRDTVSGRRPAQNETRKHFQLRMIHSATAAAMNGAYNHPISQIQHRESQSGLTSSFTGRNRGFSTCLIYWNLIPIRSQKVGLRTKFAQENLSNRVSVWNWSHQKCPKIDATPSTRAAFFFFQATNRFTPEWPAEGANILQLTSFQKIVLKKTEGEKQSRAQAHVTFSLKVI